MVKKGQKALLAALATTIGTGVMAVPAMAVSNGAKAPVDDLYKAAYEATIKTQDLDNVTQSDVNVAREAIDALRGTSVESAVPTFSSIVDQAQQKFLTTAYNSIVKCQETQSQEDINIARTNIKDLPSHFKNPYSMAIDEVQQIKIDKANEAVNKAIESQKPEDVKNAQALLDDLKTVVYNDGVKSWAVETEMKLKNATVQLNIVASEALNNNTVRVVFNRAVDASTVNDKSFKITLASQEYEKLFVKSVKVSSDKMSAEITTSEIFTDAVNYKVSASGIKDNKGNAIADGASSTFKYENAAVKSIEFSTTNIPLGADLRDYLVIKDKLGRDVTNEYKDELTFTTSNSNIINVDGIATSVAPAVNNNTVVVGVKVNGTSIETETTLKVTQSVATKMSGFAIVTGEVNENETFSQISSDKKASYVSVDQKNAKLVVGFKDQHGKELTLKDSKYAVIRNHTPEVAMVEDNGTIKAFSKGEAYITIKCGAIQETIKINVEEAALPGTIKPSQNSYTLATTNADGIDINYVVNNQFGKKYTGNDEVTSGGVTDSEANSQKLTSVKITAPNGKETDKFVINTDSVGNVKISKKAGEQVESGSYKVTLLKEFTYKGQNKEAKEVVTLNVVQGQDLKGYETIFSSESLDVNGNDKSPKESLVTVYKLDTNNNRIGKVEFGQGAEKASIEVEGTQGGLLVDGNKITAQKEGTYTVKVKVDSKVVKQITIKVANTTPIATTIDIGKEAPTVDSGASIKDMLNKVGYKVLDQSGNDMKLKIKGIEYTVVNPEGASIVSKNSLADTFKYTGVANGKSGSVEILITKLTVGNENNNENDKDMHYTSTPYRMKVTVNNTAKAALEEAPVVEKVTEEVKPEVKEEVKSEVKEEVKSEVKEEVKSEVKEEVKTEENAQK